MESNAEENSALLFNAFAVRLLYNQIGEGSSLLFTTIEVGLVNTLELSDFGAMALRRIGA